MIKQFRDLIRRRERRWPTGSTIAIEFTCLFYDLVGTTRDTLAKTAAKIIGECGKAATSWNPPLPLSARGKEEVRRQGLGRPRSEHVKNFVVESIQGIGSADVMHCGDHVQKFKEMDHVKSLLLT